MVFNSSSFLVFFLLFFPIYWFINNRFSVTVRNNGALDANDVLLVLYLNEPDTAEMRQLSHANVPVVHGLESVTVQLADFRVPDGTRDLWVLLDPKFQLSESQKAAGVTRLQRQVKKP